jgi:metal-responsive CopG/Arc/MetJ family transcriptional regulator
VAARSVQISIDEELLRAIDRDPDARKLGRSAVIRRALRFYLLARERNEINEAYDRAYGGRGDDVYEEFGPLLRGQAWPEK